MLSTTRSLDKSSPLLSPHPRLRPLDYGSNNTRTWDICGAKAEVAARARAYPSPPMSESPSLPPKDPREFYGRSDGPGSHSIANLQDAYRTSSTQQRQVDPRLHLPPPPRPPQPQPSQQHQPRLSQQYHQEPSMEPPYGYRGPEEHTVQPPLYSPRDPQGISQGPHVQPYSSAVASSSSTSQQSIGSGSTSMESQSMGSPKSQRKTKGHVASACVPCKRAHLRCDAQRPCSRCISNGKEDACVDVQHKKRGRPRLRDDRDARFDPMRPPHSQDVSPRRPLSIYPSAGTGPPLFDETFQRHQSFRPSEMSAGNSFSARHAERASSSESNSYNTPLSATPGSPEPVAYLTMGLEIVKGSPAFWDAVGLPNLAGRSLAEMVLPAELEKVSHIQSHFSGEQKRREPNYLPPIIGHGSQSIQGLGFSVEDFGRFPLNFHDHLAFVGANGYARPMVIRAGLAKEGSFYFIVLLLNIPPRQPQVSPIPNAPGLSATLAYKRPSPEAIYAQRPPFDPIRGRPGENPHSATMSVEPSSHSGRPTSFIEHSPQHAARQYEASMERQQYSTRPFPFPPHDVTGQNVPVSQQSFQLPPIRSRSEQTPQSGPAAWNRGERSGRVDIGGLIDKPDEPATFRDDRR